jgi:Circularly permutated YpsA SLOG family
MALGIACGGWCPPGRECEDGVIPGEYPLVETPLERSPFAPEVARSQRTEWNVLDSDGTLILMPGSVAGDKGTEWTLRCAGNYQRPCLFLDPYDAAAAIGVKAWIRDNNIKVLNVAGPSERTCPGIGERVYELLQESLGRGAIWRGL